MLYYYTIKIIGGNVIIKIYSQNVPLETTLSYALTMQQLIEQCRTLPNGENIEWYYGNYGLNLPFIVPRKNYYAVPCDIRNDNYMPVNFDQVMNMVKPDLIFIHDDPQRCISFFERVVHTPIIYWLPWDSEDPNTRMAIDGVKNVDYLCVVAKFAQKIMQDMGFKCDQIYNPIDTSVYKPNPEAGLKLRKECNIPEDHKIITWVGRAGWRKRIPDLLAIASKIINKPNSKTHLLLHMDINGEFNNNISFIELLHSYNLLGEGKVIYPRELHPDNAYPIEKMVEIYNATDIYITTHGGEGHCLPISEAQSCGKPFIATDVTTTMEFADYKIRGNDMIGSRGIGVKQDFVFPNKGIMRPCVSIDDFVKQTEYLLADDNLRKQMGKEGRKFVIQEVDKRVVGAKWLKIFQDFKEEGIQL